MRSGVTGLPGRAAKLLRLLSRPGYRRGLAAGVAAAVEHEAAIRALPVGTLIDVGANVGQFSLLVRTLHPAARIVAFEPLAEPADRYERLFAGDPAIELCRHALGSAEGNATIHLSRRLDSSSLLPISPVQERTFAGTDEVGVRTVPVHRLDAVLRPAALTGPVLLKLDVQGFELEVIRGFAGGLAAVDHVYAEVSFLPLYEGQPLAPVIIADLHERGFDLAGVYNLSTDRGGRSVQADMLFANRRRSAVTAAPSPAGICPDAPG